MDKWECFQISDLYCARLKSLFLTYIIIPKRENENVQVVKILQLKI
jgi:hypothetical protein